MHNQTKTALIAVTLVVLAALLIFVYQSKPAKQEPIDERFSNYLDNTNRAEFMFNKNWQVSTSYGFARLVPETNNGQVQNIQINYAPTEQAISDLKFTNDVVVSVSGRQLKKAVKTTPWKNDKGEELFTTTTNYYLLELDGRKVLIELNPGIADQDLSDEFKKLIETLKFS